MSLGIDTGRVKQILLPDGEWHEIVEGSFNTDAYEYVEGTGTVPSSGQAKETIASAGATWRERHSYGKERTLFCPLTAIQAVSYGWFADKKPS